MTCIVGLQTKNKKVILGGDSAGVSSSYEHIIRSDPKVFKNKMYAIGYTSSFRMGQILRHSWEPPTTIDSNPDNHMFALIESIKDCLIKFNYATNTNNEQKGGTFLIAWDNHLYTVFNDFQYAKNKTQYASVGCGSSYAYGSLYSSQKSELSDKERVKLALESASFFSGGVKPPFVYITT